MNNIAIKGHIRDIEFSHKVGDIEYKKAKVVCPGINGKEDDLLLIRFKSFYDKYTNGDYIELQGNLRSYSTKKDNKSKVEIYIFTYFDLPNIPCGKTQIDGRICKKEEICVSNNNKKYIHFILANNIFNENRSKISKINSYLPCTAYGEMAEKIDKLNISDFISIDGELHSHTYKRKSDKEIILAHEIVVNHFIQDEI